MSNFENCASVLPSFEIRKGSGLLDLLPSLNSTVTES